MVAEDLLLSAIASLPDVQQRPLMDKYHRGELDGLKQTLDSIPADKRHGFAQGAVATLASVAEETFHVDHQPPVRLHHEFEHRSSAPASPVYVMRTEIAGRFGSTFAAQRSDSWVCDDAVSEDLLDGTAVDFMTSIYLDASNMPATASQRGKRPSMV